MARGFLLVGMLLGPLLLLRTGWHEIPYENEVQLLAYVRQQAEPGWLSHDFALGRPTPYHLVFASVGAAVSRIWSIQTFAVAYRLLNISLFSAGFVLLGRALGLKPFDILASFLAYCVFFTLPLFQMAKYGLFLTTAEPNPTAWGLGLLGYAAAVYGRWYTAGALLGVAGSVHVLTGTQFGAPFLVSAMLFAGQDSGVPGRRIKRVLGVWTIWLLLASAGLGMQAAELVSRPISAAASKIYFERAAHHLDVARFIPQLVASITVLVAALALRRLGRDVPKAEDDRCLVMAMIFIAGYWALGVLFRVFGVYSLLKGYPYRTWPLVGILAILYGFRALRALPAWQRVSDRGSKILGSAAGLGIGVAVLAFLSTAVTLHADVHLRSALGVPVVEPSWKGPDAQALYTWVRTHTDPSSVFLTSPDFWWSDFQWGTNRGMVFQEKSLPHDSDGMIEWRRRLDLLREAFTASPGGTPGRERLAFAISDLRPNFLVLRRADFITASGWTSCYENDTFVVYAPIDAPGEGSRVGNRFPLK